MSLSLFKALEKKDILAVERLLREMLETNPEFKRWLLSTGTDPITKYNTIHSNFWGYCTCPQCNNRPHENNLGMLLMQLRIDLMLAEE